MKRSGYFLLCCLLVFCAGCSLNPPDSANSSRVESGFAESATDSPSSPVTVLIPSDGMPNVITDSEVTLAEDASSVPEVQSRYIANTHSKVFHKADCRLVKNMKAENKRAFSERSQAFSEGYRPCSQCRP